MEKTVDKNCGQDKMETSVNQGYYESDIEYQSVINNNQSPLLMSIVSAIGGFVPPDLEGKFVYCDLGCGDGTTINALAEIYDNGYFIGIDFNANHIEAARATAKEHELSNVYFIKSSFSTLYINSLPYFDFVGIHGTYSWLEEQEEKAVHKILQERLKSGGLFYVEYTCLPGKISVQPFWSLIKYLVPESNEQNNRERARQGLKLMESLTKKGMTYLAAHRPVANAVHSYIRVRRNEPNIEDHFAHNVLASGFRPRYFTEMYNTMSSIDLNYAGRCEIRLNELELSVSPAHVPIFQDYKYDVKIVELLKDYIRNEQQRHDVFVKSGKVAPDEANSWINKNLFLLSRMSPDTVQRFISTLGNYKIPLNGSAYEAVIHSTDNRTITPEEVAIDRNLPIERVRKASLRLLASNQFFHCRHRVNNDLPNLQEISGIVLLGKMNRRNLDLAFERFSQNQLISSIAGGPAIPITAIEAVVIKSILEKGTFEGVAERSIELLKEETRILTTVKGQKKGKDVTMEEFEEVLKVLLSRKIFNMLRLGIVKPS